MSNSPDSIGSGASYYSNLYRQDPGFRQADRVAVDQRRRIDSIQSEHQRIENDMQNQFQNNLRMPPGSVVLAAQVGRFIVMVVFMPPYYVIYKIPTWLFQQAKPYILEGLEKGEELFKLAQSFIILNLKALFQYTVEKPLNVFRKLFKKAAKPTDKALHKETAAQTRLIDQPLILLKAIIKPFQFLAHQLTKVISHTQTKFQEYKKTFTEVFKQFYPNVKKYVSEKLHQFQNTVKTRIEKVTSTLRPYVQKVNAAVNTAVNAVIRKTQETVQNTVVAPVKIVTQFIQKIVVQNMVIPLQTFIKEMVQENIRAPLKRAAAAIAAPFKNMTKQVVARIESIKDSATVHLQNVVKAATALPMALIANFSAKAIPALQNSVKQFLVPFRRTAAAVKRIGNTIKRGVQRVAEKTGEYLKEKMANLKQWSDKGKKALLKNAEIVLSKVKKVPASLLQRLKRIFSWIRQALAKFYKSLKVVFIWVKILIRYSFQKPT